MLWGACCILGLTSGKNESSVNALHTYETHERPEVSIYERMCACKAAPQLLSGPRGPSAFPCTAPFDSTGSPNAPSTSFLLSFGLVFTLLHFLCLPLFHALSSHHTVGGAEQQYLEFPRAPVSGIPLLLGCRKMSRATRRIRITAIDIFARSCDSVACGGSSPFDW